MLLDYQPEEQETEIEKATREAAEKTLANVQAKQHARVLGGGPSAAPYFRGEERDDRLENPSSYGGSLSVLTQRLKERRESDF